MTATLVAKELSGGHDHRTLFSKLSLTVAPGDVVGVVGANGAGKSTLLRLLAGVDQPQQGSVSLAPADAFVGWLPQEHLAIHLQYLSETKRVLRFVPHGRYYEGLVAEFKKTAFA